MERQTDRQTDRQTEGDEKEDTFMRAFHLYHMVTSEKDNTEL